jgi:hypothetical protein
MQDDALSQLASIREVVDRARAERVRNGDIYVVWGVVLVLCIALTLLADALGQEYGWVAFPVLCTAAAAWSAWTARARGMRRATYGARIEGTMWASVGAAMFVLVFGGLASGALPLEAVVPIVLVMAGVGLFTAGAIYQEALLRWPGVAFGLTALPCMLLPWRAQYVVFGLALIAGYIVPGVLLMRKERSAA